MRIFLLADLRSHRTLEHRSLELCNGASRMNLPDSSLKEGGLDRARGLILKFRRSQLEAGVLKSIVLLLRTAEGFILQVSWHLRINFAHLFFWDINLFNC